MKHNLSFVTTPHLGLYLGLYLGLLLLFHVEYLLLFFFSTSFKF